MSQSRAHAPMTADEYIAWALAQPEGQRYELEDGEIVPMASERTRHSLMKGLIYRRLHEAAREAKLACQIFPDGMSIRIDDRRVYEPDAALRVGKPLDDDAVTYDDPLIVVEVVSPSSKNIDSGVKLTRYFGLPSLRHYLIVDVDGGRVAHHGRADVGAEIRTAIQPLTTSLRLDPPGITIADFVED